MNWNKGKGANLKKWRISEKKLLPCKLCINIGTKFEFLKPSQYFLDRQKYEKTRENRRL